MSEFPNSLEVEGGPPPRLEWRQWRWRPECSPTSVFSSWYLVESDLDPEDVTDGALEEFRRAAALRECEPPRRESLPDFWLSLHRCIAHVEGMTLSACPECGERVPRLEEAEHCYNCGTCCEECYTMHAPSSLITVGETQFRAAHEYCSDCVGRCSRSGCSNHAHPADSYCPTHLEEMRACSQCEEWELTDRMTICQERWVCEECRDRHYTSCEHCGEYEYDRNLRNGACRACRDSNDYLPSSGIHSYTYKPRPIFFASLGDSTPFFGLEIEVEAVHDESSPERGAELARRHCSDLIYCKSDRSLDNGVELVTHPMSLEYLQRCDSLEALLESLGAEGFRAWKTTTCGLHVHVSRAAFHSSSHAFRFALFHYRNADEVARFSGRTTRALNDYARLTHHQGDGDDWPRLSQKIRHQGNIAVERYTAVNLANSSTLEVRIFRGTLSFSSIVGNVEYLHALWAFTWSLSSHDVLEGRLSWSSLVEWVRSDETRAALYGRFLDLEARRFARVSA